ncbi:hypothetical protein THAR02_09857 [Trichoderma harzianum]|uniref:Uncharacterized protein n=1 Tax=Trichoderma harzianum TaxID=5544 RepID=A0A0F9WY44_TRIHA|nr:hypothetical protein THAR02_09857 [Trichoderma harzianum]
MVQYEHSPKEKAKARKSGPSLCNKTRDLGVLANIFAMAAYWDPTHHCYRVQVHLPEGEKPPDINGLVEEILSEATSKRSSRRRGRILSQSGQRHLRQDAKIASMRLSRKLRQCSHPSITREVIDAQDSDRASVDSISQAEGIENEISKLTINVETVEEEPIEQAIAEQQQQLSRTETAVNQQDHNTQNHIESPQFNSISQNADNLYWNDWGSVSGSCYDALDDVNYSTSSPIELYSYEETAVLPPLRELPRPRASKETKRQLLNSIRSLQSILDGYNYKGIQKMTSYFLFPTD